MLIFLLKNKNLEKTAMINFLEETQSYHIPEKKIKYFLKEL